MRRVTWLGHATVLIETGDGTRLLTDPLLRRRIAHLRRHAPPVGPLPAVDGVLISHVHLDHLDRPTLKRLATEATTVVLPRGAEPLVRGLGFGAVAPVAAGEATTVGGAAVDVVPAWHPTRRWPRAPQLDALGFVADGVWFAGDTDLDERMAALRGRVELALVPIWGWGPSLGPGHLDPEGAARALALVRPRIAVPIHWGTYLPYGLRRRHGHLLRTPALEFAGYAMTHASDTEVVVLAPGGALEL